MINKIVKRKTVNISLPIIFNICFGAQKNHLIETVLMSTHKMYLFKNKKINFSVRTLNSRPDIRRTQNTGTLVSKYRE